MNNRLLNINYNMISKMIFLKTSSRFWLIFSLMTFLISCKENNHKQEITQIIQEWQGKEIVFPEDPIFTQFGNDTIPSQSRRYNHSGLH